LTTVSSLCARATPLNANARMRTAVRTRIGGTLDFVGSGVHEMASRLRAFSSSVGTKILIGITGLALFLYLVIHIAGNLMVFLGPEAFNKYAYTLEGNPLLPIVEIGLLLIFVLHVYKTA